MTKYSNGNIGILDLIICPPSSESESSSVDTKPKEATQND